MPLILRWGESEDSGKVFRQMSSIDVPDFRSQRRKFRASIRQEQIGRVPSHGTASSLDSQLNPPLQTSVRRYAQSMAKDGGCRSDGDCVGLPATRGFPAKGNGEEPTLLAHRGISQDFD